MPTTFMTYIFCNDNITFCSTKPYMYQKYFGLQKIKKNNYFLLERLYVPVQWDKNNGWFLLEVCFELRIIYIYKFSSINDNADSVMHNLFSATIGFLSAVHKVNYKSKRFKRNE